MSLPRREFLRSSLGFGALFALRGIVRAASPASPPLTAANGTSRPGLLFDAADLPRIRANVQRPEFAEFWTYMTTVDFAAEEKFLTHELSLRNHIADMGRAQTIMMRSAFVHLLFPDAQHLALARLALKRLLDYPRWDWLRDSQHQPVAILRGAGTAMALALVSEWLAPELTAEDQAAISRGMATEGGEACARGVRDMNHHDQAGPWGLNPDEEGLPPVDVARWPRILDETNLRITCTAGLAVAAVHLWEKHPEAPAWLALARDSMKLYASRMNRDGSFGEGIGYWDFTFMHYCFVLEIFRRKLGIDDRGLLDFPLMARYALDMTMPTAGHPDDCINLGDAFVAAGSIPLSWTAREFRDGCAQWLTLQPKAIRPNWTTSWTAVWFDSTVPARLPAQEPLDRRQALGIIISRTGWDVQDNVVVLRSGGPINHEHADRNSVIFKAHGERLFNDPVHASYSTRDPKWLLRQTEAHTSVLIDGHGHVYHDGHDGTNSSTAAAQIQDYRLGPGWMTVTSDATDAYKRANLPAKLVQRTLIYLKPDVLAIFDHVILKTALPISARFQVFNEDGEGRAAVNAGTFTIERPQATLLARVLTAGASSLATGRLKLPESGGIYPFTEISSAAATEHMLFTVCSTAPDGEAHGDITVTHEGGFWNFAGTHRGQAVKASFVAADGSSAPLITL